MRLDVYLREQRITQTQFGERLVPPVSQTLVSQWFRGVTRVTLDQALQIEKLTDGKVMPADCAALYVPRDSTGSTVVGSAQIGAV